MNAEAGGSAKGLRLCLGIGVAWVLSFAGALLLGPAGAGAAFGGVMLLALIGLVLVQAVLLYGWRGAALYLVLGTAIGFSLEASSVATGFPFGSYVHNLAGPKPAGVPIQAILTYVLAGWYGWTIARAILLDRPERLTGAARFTVPLIAAFVLTGLDLPNDPIGATIRHDWTYKYPSGYFGVPLTNYLGWIFTGWVLFQLFALIEHRFPAGPAARSRWFWLMPCLVWLLMPLQFVASWLSAPAGVVTLKQSTFVIADMHEAGLITGLFGMTLPALIGIFRLFRN
ncbi:carotenoid biosynthesis protein [Novosphingobium bradum]|uniref:Carotenoid biosynthesis protein n=2 Tax=Novosphingobium bradum TaxID=1737444 RepID=A0ABV7IR51_9SPHN